MEPTTGFGLKITPFGHKTYVFQYRLPGRGHRSRQATEIYAHFAPDALRQAADARAKAMRKAVDRAKNRENTAGKQ